MPGVDPNSKTSPIDRTNTGKLRKAEFNNQGRVSRSQDNTNKGGRETNQPDQEQGVREPTMSTTKKHDQHNLTASGLWSSETISPFDDRWISDDEYLLAGRRTNFAARDGIKKTRGDG